MGPARPLQALKLLALLLVPVLLWDFSGWDLSVARWLGDADGFAARHSVWAELVLHEGGRWASGTLLLAVAMNAFWPGEPARPGPSRAQRRWALLALVLVLLLVPTLKRLSLTSCPWSLAEFGGVAQWVPHWRWGVPDGGPGGCFPSGHAGGQLSGLHRLAVALDALAQSAPPAVGGLVPRHWPGQFGGQRRPMGAWRALCEPQPLERLVVCAAGLGFALHLHAAKGR